MQSVQVCPNCRGEGTIIAKKCPNCHGEGRQEKTEQITVKIPGGIDDGQRIKLSGRGEAGVRGTPSGDLYLEVAVAKDPVFHRDGDDILVTSAVPMTVATLGGTGSVKTVE